MATLLFTWLHFMGYTEWDYEWYIVCFLLAVDTISFMLLLLNIQICMWMRCCKSEQKQGADASGVSCKPEQKA
ncbi:MAG: hypothetical protein HZB79_09140 [Deltaproteobacteria bacterium]|nr:hypothetical protein [Deltaproteobacteria bacterium]